ncbi:hypothetical protein BH23BAC4_BH23BAC4_10600 [soil metagenome]
MQIPVSRLAFVVCIAGAIGMGCAGAEPVAPATTTTATRSAPDRPAPPASAPYAVFDGVTLSGAWDAIAALDDRDVDRDLETGVLERQLVFYPGSRIVLTGVDRRAGGDRVTYQGMMEGRNVRFENLPGTATLRGDSGRLVLTDPASRRTVFARR